MIDEELGHPQDIRADRLVGFRVMWDAVKRRKRFWMGTAAAGVVIGSTLSLVLPHKYSAITRLYLTEPSGSDAAVAMATDISLLQTASVASQALTALHLSTPPQTFLTTYRGTSESDAIMSIKLTAPSKAAAVQRDAAVAQAFLNFRAASNIQQSQAVVNSLNSQVASLNADIAKLTASINSLSASAGSINSLSGSSTNPSVDNDVSSLVSDRSVYSAEVSQLQSQIQNTQLATVSQNSGSRVLDPAAPVHVSAVRTLVVDGLSGLAGGLGLGLLIVAIGAAVSDRVYRREDVARALGAPVELSVSSYRRPRLFRRRRMAERLTRPPSALWLVQSRLRSRLESSPSRSLAVVPLHAEEAAAIAVGTLALDLAAEGMKVTVVDLGRDRCVTDLMSTAPSDLITLDVAPPSKAAGSPSVSPDADAVLVVATLDPCFGAEHVALWSTDAVVLVQPGEVGVGDLHAARRMLMQAGITVASAVLIGSDPYDESYGGLLAGAPEDGGSRLEPSWAQRW